MSYDVCVKTLSESRGRALSALISKFDSLQDVDFKTYTRLCHSNVVPILDYTSSIWGNHPAKCINNIQNRVARYFVGVHKYTPLLSIIGEILWELSENRRKFKIIKFWNKMINMNRDRLPKYLFNYEYDHF